MTTGGEIEVAQIGRIGASLGLAGTERPAVVFANREKQDYVEHVRDFLSAGGKVWLIQSQGSVDTCTEAVQQTLAESGFERGRAFDLLCEDIHLQLQLMVDYLQAQDVSVTLYSRSMFLGIDYFRGMLRATPHTDPVRLVSALVGEGTAYVERQYFRPDRLEAFQEKWNRLVKAYDDAADDKGRWGAVEDLQTLIQSPNFIEPPGRVQRLAEGSVGIFDNREIADKRNHFWHWIPYSAEHRLILNVDPIEA